MSKQERSRKSAPHNRAISFQNAEKSINPTESLTDIESERFHEIIGSREHSSWVPADIELATKMAMAAAERDDLRVAYQVEGVRCEDHNGKPIINPLYTAHKTKFDQVEVMRRQLGLGASQRNIAGHKQRKRNEQDAAAAKVSSLQGLIATPQK